MANTAINQSQERQQKISDFTSDMADLIKNDDPENVIRDYLHFIDEIKEAGPNAMSVLSRKLFSDLNPVNSQKKTTIDKFSRRKVQIAAIAVMMRLQKSEGNEKDNEVFEDARKAYISASGHYKGDKNICMPEISQAADSRRENAAKQWAAYARADPKELITYVVSPDRVFMNSIDYIKGIGSLIGLIAFAAVAYFVWAYQS